jgi:hypothetical protein
MNVIASRRPDPEAEAMRAEAESLCVLVRECASSGIARRVLLLRLSHVPEELARPHHLRLARAALDPLSHADRARVFRLPNGDVAVVWRGEAAAALRASLEAVLLLFSDEQERVPDPAALVLSFRLPEEAGALLEAVQEALLRPGDDGGAGAAAGTGPTDPLDPPALAALEGALAQADVARFVRRRQICERLPDGTFRLRWEKRALSVVEIAAALLPERAVRADPWLFRRLTRTLDRRMLALLAAPQELHNAGPFSLNLNVASILSPEFLRFDAVLPAVLRGQVMIDLMPADIMTDPAAFLFARDFAHDRGYRLLLRSVTAELLEVFPLRRIGLDLLSLRFSPELVRLDPDLAPPDAENTVLTRADTAEALAWGQAQGILLYLGRAAAPSASRALPAR